MAEEFYRINRLPPYIFNIVNELKVLARKNGDDIIDFGMGNPDQKTPEHIIKKMQECSDKESVHRYSSSKGIPRLRKAISNWYEEKFNVSIDPEEEAIVTIGSKEGLAHLALATLNNGDSVIVPSPAYPIHPYGAVIAGAEIIYIKVEDDSDIFFSSLDTAINNSWPTPKMIIANFPSNPTTKCVDINFLKELVRIAKKYNIYLVHDIAYADIVFDGYRAPSILQVDGAKDIAVEFYTLSKSYNMPGWRIGFMCGNSKLVDALSRIKSYMDYGTYTPLQVGAIAALEGSQDCVEDIRMMYKNRRDALCKGLNSIGWPVTPPKATMFVWSEIPEKYKDLGSLEFSKMLLSETNVAVSPGIGFGKHGDNFVRFSLIENEQRTKQAVRSLKSII
ncbi:MAG: alanine transaminase [Gammaproteobacteria bacterium]|jgi:alanine-synthesizing transaminase|nr:alanine transaminase [Gammaproteobacteria bacterium]MBT6755219.1 alanine transaminase [Gammaproteobacteria bacterium]MBT7523422.1 alanine transaminase [Gammaproteobacteria bacterium]MBT7814796.1 alanine transaminase [Gammaproteobacteria bacterium]